PKDAFRQTARFYAEKMVSVHKIRGKTSQNYPLLALYKKGGFLYNNTNMSARTKTERSECGRRQVRLEIPLSWSREADKAVCLHTWGRVYPQDTCVKVNQAVRLSPGSLVFCAKGDGYGRKSADYG